MSDKMRWKHGDTNPVVAAVDSATVIEIGDLVWQDVDKARSASEIDAWRPDEPGIAEMNQKAFAELFLGVAMQRSRSGDVAPISEVAPRSTSPAIDPGITAPIRVATTGVFEFDCISQTFELGDPVGCDVTNLTRIIGDNPGTNRDVLCNQRVQKVTDPKFTIGVVAKYEHEPSSTVLVDIRSKVMGW